MANEPVSAENVLKVTQDLAAIIQKQFLLVQAIQAVLIANDLLNLDELNLAIESIQAGKEVIGLQRNGSIGRLTTQRVETLESTRFVGFFCEICPCSTAFPR